MKIKLLLGFVGFLLLPFYYGGNIQQQYGLAKKFLDQGAYIEAESQFERLALSHLKKNPQNEQCQIALYQAAMIEAVFLMQYEKAIPKLNQYIQIAKNSDYLWKANLQLGDCYYALERFPSAISHYKKILNQRDDPHLLYQIGMSHFFQREFNEALVKFKEIQKKFPKTPWAQRASFQQNQVELVQKRKK